MFDMLKKLNEAQRVMKEVKERLDGTEVEGCSPGKKVCVTLTASKNCISVKLNDPSLCGNVNDLELHFTQALNEALAKADEVSQKEMKSAAGNDIPGMGGLIP
ncbi:MAG: hypothetical protein Kow0075_15190 [Salibacteraceae bacterium]